MRKCAKSWESMPKAEKVCLKLRKYTKKWGNLPKAEKVWESKTIADKVLKIMQKV